MAQCWFKWCTRKANLTPLKLNNWKNNKNIDLVNANKQRTYSIYFYCKRTKNGHKTFMWYCFVMLKILTDLHCSKMKNNFKSI